MYRFPFLGKDTTGKKDLRGGVGVLDMKCQILSF